MTPEQLIAKLREIAKRETTSYEDAAFLEALADLVHHRAIDPAYSVFARQTLESIGGELGTRLG